mmetsp:Transcript_23719/g.66614  ORF Transcript_23719/g.66614 Transcript_23719/m.66614 type:complete len:227 (-) Transcript_23719:664-1344(-)
MSSWSMTAVDSPLVIVWKRSRTFCSMFRASARALAWATAWRSFDFSSCAVRPWSSVTCSRMAAITSCTSCLCSASLSPRERTSTFADMLSTRSETPLSTAGQCSVDALASSFTRASTLAKAACTSPRFSGLQTFTVSTAWSPSSSTCSAPAFTALPRALLTAGHFFAPSAISCPAPACMPASASCTFSWLYVSTASSASSRVSPPTAEMKVPVPSSTGAILGCSSR